MVIILRFCARARVALERLNAWQRLIQTRNSINDARRAQARRLQVQQNYMAPMLAGCPCNSISSRSSPRLGTK